MLSVLLVGALASTVVRGEAALAVDAAAETSVVRDEGRPEPLLYNAVQRVAQVPNLMQGQWRRALYGSCWTPECCQAIKSTAACVWVQNCGLDQHTPMFMNDEGCEWRGTANGVDAKTTCIEEKAANGGDDRDMAACCADLDNDYNPEESCEAVAGCRFGYDPVRSQLGRGPPGMEYSACVPVSLHEWDANKCTWEAAEGRFALDVEPEDEGGAREQKCIEEGSPKDNALGGTARYGTTFRRVPINTNPAHRYEAGFECCPRTVIAAKAILGLNWRNSVQQVDKLDWKGKRVLPGVGPVESEQ